MEFSSAVHAQTQREADRQIRPPVALRQLVVLRVLAYTHILCLFLACQQSRASCGAGLAYRQWHWSHQCDSFWWTYTGYVAASISSACWCTAAWTEQHRDTWRTRQCLSAVLHVVSYAQRRPLIWWYHKPVAHQLETVCLPWQVHRRGTVYASPPLNLQIVHFLQKNLNHFFLDSHSGRDNVNFDYVKRSSNSSYRIIALNKLY